MPGAVDKQQLDDFVNAFEYDINTKQDEIAVLARQWYYEQTFTDKYQAVRCCLLKLKNLIESEARYVKYYYMFERDIFRLHPFDIIDINFFNEVHEEMAGFIDEFDSVLEVLQEK